VGGVPDLDAFLILSNGSSKSSIRSRGYYFTTDLDYDDRYIVSALLRRDGSSLFGREERWHWYYRASAAWRMGAEAWWPWPETINEFKLHYSRGTAGGRPGFSDRFETFGIGTNGLTLGTLGNIFLKPEKTTEQEFGVDVVALGMFSLSLAHARQRTAHRSPASRGFRICRAVAERRHDRRPHVGRHAGGAPGRARWAALVHGSHRGSFAQQDRRVRPPVSHRWSRRSLRG
jgi:hypothetical protein